MPIRTISSLDGAEWEFQVKIAPMAHFLSQLQFELLMKSIGKNTKKETIGNFN